MFNIEHLSEENKQGILIISQSDLSLIFKLFIFVILLSNKAVATKKEIKIVEKPKTRYHFFILKNSSKRIIAFFSTGRRKTFKKIFKRLFLTLKEVTKILNISLARFLTG